MDYEITNEMKQKFKSIKLDGNLAASNIRRDERMLVSPYIKSSISN